MDARSGDTSLSGHADRALALFARAVRQTAGQSAPGFRPIADALRRVGDFDAVAVARLNNGQLVSLAVSQAKGQPPIALPHGLRESSRRSRAGFVDIGNTSRGNRHALAPISVDGHPWGFIIARESVRGSLDQFGLRLLDFCAAVAAGLARADTVSEQRATIAQQDWELHGQRELLRVAESMLVSIDPTALLQEIVDRLGSVVEVDTIDLALHDPAARVLRTVAAKGLHAEVLAEHSEIADDQGIMGWVFQQGAAERVDYAAEDARLVRWPDFGQREGSLIALPLVDRSSVAGVLVMMRFKSNVAFRDEEFTLVKNFADLASIALRNASIQSAAESRARTDPMTGLRNRTALDSILEGWIHSSSRFSLLMIDLDHFKSVNDDHGHLVGDQLLIRVAAAIRREARGSDSAFRIGGDEFLVLLDSASSAGAVAVAYRLTDTVRASAQAATAELGLKQRIPVTCSIGVASYPLNGVSPAELIRAADAAAYEAKRAGRDQVRIAETP